MEPKMVTGCSPSICICMSCPRRDNKSVTDVSSIVSICSAVDGNNVSLPIFAPRIDIVLIAVLCADADEICGFGGKVDDNKDGMTL